MRYRFLSLLSACALLAGCNSSPKTDAAGGTKADAATYHGVDMAALDTTVKPGEDFYRFANGNWLKKHDIPATESMWGVDNILTEQSNADVRAILETSAKADAAAGSAQQLIGALYASVMDSAQADKLGYAPLKPLLAEIAALKSTADLPAYLGKANLTNTEDLIAPYVAQDARNSAQYILTFYQTGLGLPDRDYYFKPDSNFKEARAKYIDYLTTLGTLTGQPEAQARTTAMGVMALETELAKSHRSNVELRDPIKNYNRVDAAGLQALTPHFDWKAFFAAAHLPQPAAMVMGQPAYYKGLDAALANHPLADWQALLRLHLIHTSANHLAKPFVQARFDLFSKTLRGITEMKPRWKVANTVVNQNLGELVGQEYVKKRFTPEAKAQMLELVANVKAATAKRINEATWMADATKKQALVKLAKINVKVGYPDKWRTYAGLTLQPNDLMGNIARLNAVEVQRNFAKLGHPIDRTEWQMNAQEVNAYYDPTMNEIVFPAAILQPPYFDPLADDASNYGETGATIGHEIMHAFDDEGRQYDENGNLRDWWTKEDAVRYQAKAKALATQFSHTEALPGLLVNGELTLGENIADLSGLKIAYDALEMALAKHPERRKTLDGYTPEQRFFIAFAQSWSAKMKPQAVRTLVASNPHSPAPLRGYMPQTNMPEFYEAFHLKAGDKMMRPENERVVVW